MRHKWGGRASDTNQKGNDTLLIGWQKFLKSQKHKKAVLVLFEYGDDVQNQKS